MTPRTCEYCDETEGLRIPYAFYGPEGSKWGPSFVCEECFTGPDTGPCFDDLQTAEEYDEANSQFGVGA